jgi:aminopeptidase N
MKYILFFITCFSFAQQTQFVDFKSVSGQLKLNAAEKSLSGSVDYAFEVLQPIDTIKIDAKSMEFTQVKVDGKEVFFVNTDKELKIVNHFLKGTKHLTF